MVATVTNHEQGTGRADQELSWNDVEENAMHHSGWGEAVQRTLARGNRWEMWLLSTPTPRRRLQWIRRRLFTISLILLTRFTSFRMMFLTPSPTQLLPILRLLVLPQLIMLWPLPLCLPPSSLAPPPPPHPPSPPYPVSLSSLLISLLHAPRLLPHDPRMDVADRS